MSEREFDIVLWGASGFTGRLVAQYLAHQRRDLGGLRWALGGRNEKKLAEVRAELQAPDLPLVLGDGEDADSMRRLAERTKVVCTTVGPYARFGTPLVEACAGIGTHYCDLVGEVHWVRRMIDRFEDVASDSGARIVPSCGFDSIPSDLGVFYVQRETRARHGAPSPHVKGRVAGASGGASGGTIASALHMLEEAASDTEVGRILTDPYALNPAGQRNGPEQPDQNLPIYDDDFEQWTAPFFMAGVNTRVVRRSGALLGSQYGEDFRYDESTLSGDGPVGAMRAAATSLGTGLAMGAMALSPIRRLAGPRLPQPGEGPSARQREEGYWDLRFWAAPPRGVDAPPVRARLTGDRDPGYGSTSKMLAESALCLATDELPSRVGFLTPASAMGDALIPRLEGHAGVGFEILPDEA